MHFNVSRVQRFARRIPKGLAHVWSALARRLRKGPADDINSYDRRVYSQNGEDGIIAEIFARVPPTRHYFAEFGAQDGMECNAANLARRRGWSGFMIEADPQTAQRLARNYRLLPVHTVQAFVDRDNIAGLFQASGVPQDLDLLSIDIDGNDYWVWEALAIYRASLVVIEYNPTYPPPVRWIMSYNAEHRWDGTTYQGASLSSLAALAERLGYSLLGTDRNGVNAFFLRNDLVASAGFRIKTPEEAYHFQRVFPKTPFGYGPFVEA